MLVSRALIIVLSLTISQLACFEFRDDVLLIATAANVQFAMEEVIQTFTNKTGIECEMITGSSGKISAQIREGAPFDIFLSADIEYPKRIYREGFAWSPPVVYAEGKIVFWSLREEDSIDLNRLVNENIDYIAVANPKIAPYGAASLNILRFYNLLEIIEHKLVYGESIAQVNQFINSGAAYGGFTAKAAVMAPKMAGIGKWKEMDERAYDPIKQGAVVLRGTKVLNEARKFMEFLTSENAMTILLKYGYEIKREVDK